MTVDQESSSSDEASEVSLELALIPLGIALNLAIGTLVQTVRAPVYLDAVGTIVVTLMVGMRAGVATGVISFLVGGVLTNPILPWFSGTQAAIAVYVGLVARRGAFRTSRRTLVTGIGLGVIAGLVSAPVIVALFGGITGSGRSVIVAFLLASGRNVVESVVMSGLAAEPLDKALQCILAVWLIRGLPRSLLTRFQGGFLRENDLA